MITEKEHPPGASTFLPLEVREPLARALHDMYRRQSHIYHSDQDNATSWAASADDRRLWHQRAQEVWSEVLEPLGWRPPEVRP